MTSASTSQLSPIGLLSFPHLWVAKPPAPGAEPRFSLVLVFDADAQKTPEFKALRDACAAAAQAEWGSKRPNNLRSPIRKGEEKAYAGYGVGKVFCSFWSKDKPGIVDNRRQEILVPGDVFPGQLARVSYRAFAYNVSGNAGISLGLNNVQICKKDMPRLDGRKAAKDEFADVADEGAGVGDTAADDEIPF